MNKSQLIDKIANNADISRVSASRFLTAFTNAVSETLKAGEDVVLVGFGTFSVRERSARNGRNPKTGEAISIPSCKVPGFRAGKTLKSNVN